ncbi:MAG: ribonuclease R [Psychroflexus sp.]|jgi:ribonuclease R/exosome complex exonuclease DIS3/RRP44|nr:ribonuclease R [Psychroflexus sp.]MDR9447897.1 ribonuclease R [Psychroflexus sp.]
MSRGKRKKAAEDFTRKILNLLHRNAKALSHTELADLLKIKDDKRKKRLLRTLGKLTAEEKITQQEDGKFSADADKDLFEGIVDATSKGDAYIITEDLEKDIHVKNKDLNHALDGDRVEVYVFNKRFKSNSSGEVTKILERSTNRFVGILEKQKTFGFVVMQNPKMYTDIFVPESAFENANDGDVVLVEIQSWKDKDDSPRGKVIEVLGKPGDHGTEIHSILAQYGLPEAFPEEVNKFADHLDTSIQAKEIKKRKDIRNILTFTIDPASAKDFDDALSFQELDNGHFQVGIHIADVSHYVKPKTILDEEAYERATSIYLVDRVVPMLPEVLSNDACSLRPNEDKLTFSAIFEIDKEANVHKQWFGRTVSHSDARFAYEEAQHVIETGSGEIPEQISLSSSSYQINQPIVNAILQLDQMAKKMRQKRMDNGAISFDKVEVNFRLGETNEPLGVNFKTSKDANKLIEEFMLLANRKVTEFIGKQKPKKTFVYRCHADPDDEKLEALKTVVSKFGYEVDFKDRKSTTQSINKLLAQVDGRKEQNLVDTLTIRSMSKAYYSTENIGHYGLAFDYYSHFTSPIRRYPDVMVHRLLQHYLDNGSPANPVEYEEKCKHSSEMEKIATNAERDSIKYMQVKYISQHEETKFLGVISGVTDFGLFVEIIDNKCEGMVRVKDIPGDRYYFDEEHYAVVGKQRGKMYQLGDEVYVEVMKADTIKRNIDFRLLGKEDEVSI